MNEFKTWGQCFDFTSSNREEWVNGRGRKTALINANHFTQIKGRMFPIKDITQGVMDSLKTELRETREMEDGTINKVFQYVQTTLNHCIDVGMVPCQDPKKAWINGMGRFAFKKLKVSRKTKECLTLAQVDQMAATATSLFSNQALSDSILVSAWSGMGWAEFSQLTTSDVVLDTKHPFIGIGTQRNGWNLKKECRRRNVYFPADSAGYQRVVPILSRYVDLLGPSDLIPFLGDNWQSQDRHREQFNRVRDYLGFPDVITPYTLRRTYASALAANDVHPSKTHKLMGHSQMSTTLGYYTYVDDGQLVDAMSRLEV